MTPAVQYVRASTGLQSCSLEQQGLANAAYAAVRGFQILDTYSDDGVSGLTLRARRGLQRLLADALSPARRFEAILVYDVSRWGRFQDIDEGAHYEFLCRQAGVAVHYCAEPFENEGSPEANLIKQVKRAMAAEFSRAQSERVALGRRYVVTKGFTDSPPPFGLRRLAVDRERRPVGLMHRGEAKASSAHRTVFAPGPPGEVAIVQAIFRLYAVTGLSVRAIAGELNRKGGPSPCATGWTTAQVKAVLRQEAYTGTYVYGRTRCRLGEALRTPPRQWLRVEGASPAIVGRALFDRAKALLDARRWRTDEELLADLRALLHREGRITCALVDGWPYAACSWTYRRRFGSLGQACRLIGHPSRRGQS
ncbi:MAG: recombinase family protein [Phenylobacterium sp.]|uniref:recombinase family protein n=1 Tax=Phenylobacterium sp. TaxID=1871053 RepID=UPI0025DB75A5|nr:recombinase family protein [Phenylobacterium sp.]MBA4010958.1 recombinase family protein [Phenylobacterium sp.]